MTQRKPLVVIVGAGLGEVPSGDTIADAVLPLTTYRYKTAINAYLAGGVDAMFQAVVQPNEGDPTRIAWNACFAPAGGAFEGLVTTWLTLSAASGGQGLSSAAATTQVAALRSAAAALTI